MTSTLLIFIIVISIIGSFTLDSFVFHVVYLIAGTFLIGRWWTNYSISSLRVTRSVNSHAFLGEKLFAQVTIENPTILPVPWVQVRESLPLEISSSKLIQRSFTLGPRSRVSVDYTLIPQKRGYYPLGPIQLSSGDLMGLSSEVERICPSSYLTVYPRILPLKSVRIPSRSPLGILRHHQPVYEDPSRPMGKREYSPGDSLRRIDWKSTAATSHLQVKLHEPSINIETVLVLNLDQDDYHHKSLYDASELAITITASLAHWITEKRQSVGLISNGLDTMGINHRIDPIQSRKGRTNLMQILEVLARITFGRDLSITALIRHYRPRLSWGNSLIVVTGHCGTELLDELYQAQKSGINIMLLLVGQIQAMKELERKADVLNIPVYHILDERDLEKWIAT